MTKKEMIAWIDKASYEELLRKRRFGTRNFSAGAGDPFFAGEVGKHYADVMAKKREQVDHVTISKRIGWGQNWKK